MVPLLGGFPFPCLLYVGEAEWNYVGMKVASEEMPRARFISMPDYGHFDIFAHPESIVPQVRDFLEESAAS